VTGQRLESSTAVLKLVYAIAGDIVLILLNKMLGVDIHTLAVSTYPRGHSGRKSKGRVLIDLNMWFQKGGGVNGLLFFFAFTAGCC
jgi:hypothetical protein